MSLNRTELLRLRVSDGLGRQRDFDELERRGIDVDSWVDIRGIVISALEPVNQTPNLIDRVMDNLFVEEDAFDSLLGDVLQTKNEPELVSAIFDKLNIDYDNQLSESLTPKQQPELTGVILEELDVSPDGLSIREALQPEFQPDLASRVMSSIESHEVDIGSALEPSSQPDLCQRIFAELDVRLPEFEVVEADIIDEEWLNQQEQDLGVDLGSYLRTEHTANLWAAIQQELNISAIVSVEEEDKSSVLAFPDTSRVINEPTDMKSSDSSNTLNDMVDGEISKAVVIEFPENKNDISGPEYPVDENTEEPLKQSGSFAMMGIGILFAVAAGLLMMFQFDTPIDDSVSVGEEVLSLAAVNELEVESLEVGDDIMVQIFQSEENAPTIIFIDDSLIVGDDE